MEVILRQEEIPEAAAYEVMFKIALILAYNPEYCLVDLVQTLKKKGFWRSMEQRIV